MCTKCINKGDPKISLTRPFDVGTFHPIFLELRIVKLKRKDFFTLAFDVGTFITILWNWEKIMFNGLTFQICFCNLSLQRFGFIAFLCLSCHATAYPHEVGLPAHVENCCLWEIVPFMLAKAYQNVASQAQHVQFFFGVSPQQVEPCKNIPGRVQSQNIKNHKIKTLQDGVSKFITPHIPGRVRSQNIWLHKNHLWSNSKIYNFTK